MKKKRTLFFEQIPGNIKNPDDIVGDIDALIRKIYTQQTDPEGLSITIDNLSIKLAGLGNLYIQALDLRRQAETEYKYWIERDKLKYTKTADPNSEKGATYSATVAESMSKVDNKERLDELNDLEKAVDLMKIKREDASRVIETHRSRLSLIKGDIRNAEQSSTT